ncbi:thermonuclease family protein (plasmid) [Pseudorhodobacter turbinis]|uniref:Thermonuclease family protein n=2 Tax=Pseudorhodobacter turbinis TaxID=2500533 RepID=A0A4V1E1G5_9RHOB|nr:thermonuclease family protein [Pseudorhodobacter turbinis]
MEYVLMICAVLTAVDGDTVKCDGQLLRPMGDGAPFVSGFDTPELFGKKDCEAELPLARAAKQRMQELLSSEGLTIEDSGQVDNTQTHRPLVVLRLPDGTTIGQRMIDEGFARKWTPEYKADWCS